MMVSDGANNYSWGGSRKRRSQYEDGGREAKKYVNKDPLLKLLVKDYIAVALIVNRGALINEIKGTHGGNIRVSGKEEYYPGTEERVVVIMGEINQVIGINNGIMKKFQDPGSESTDRGTKVKIILTDSAAGMLIGPRGATIQAIKAESKARLSITTQDKASVPGERVLAMFGSFDECIEACKLIIEKISSEASNIANSSTKYNTNMYAGYGGSVGFNSMGSGYVGGMTLNNRLGSRSQFSVPSENSLYPGGNYMGAPSYQSGGTKLKANVVVTIEIPNVLVGGVMGKQGLIIKDFVQRSGGARFRFSDKRLNPDSSERTLTITGDMDQAQIACSLVTDRVEELGNQSG